MFAVLVSFQRISVTKAFSAFIAYITAVPLATSSFENSRWCVEEAVTPVIDAPAIVVLPLEVVPVVVDAFDEFATDAAEVHVLVKTGLDMPLCVGALRESLSVVA